jgi:hypothetical protein
MLYDLYLTLDRATYFCWSSFDLRTQHNRDLSVRRYDQGYMYVLLYDINLAI